MRGAAKRQTTANPQKPVGKRATQGRPRDEAEDNRIRALDNMKNHEALYMEFLESLAGKREAREEELKRERARIEELVDKNSKIVLKLVGSYFEELREQWVEKYHNAEQERLIGGISRLTKKARQKLSKIRKLSESFVNGDYEEDLLTYALEKDLDQTIKQIQDDALELEGTDKKSPSQVAIALKKEKVQDFFYALQELVQFSFETHTDKPLRPPEALHGDLQVRGKSLPKEAKKEKSLALAPDLNEGSKNLSGRNKPRPVLKSRELNTKDKCEADSDKSADSICLKKFVDDPKHKQLRQSPEKLRMMRLTDDSRQQEKENYADNSTVTAKEIFDLSKNSISDLLGPDLGLKKLDGHKKHHQTTDSDQADPFYLHFFQPRSNRLHVVNKLAEGFKKETMELGDFIVPRYHKSLLTNEGVIILTGGSEEDSPSKKSYLLDIERSLFMEIAEMNIGRSAHAMVAHAGLIYVIGGVSEERVSTDSCEVFSPQLNTWSEIARLNVACHSACVVSANNSIYKFGGLTDEQEVAQVIERFNGREWVEVGFDPSKTQLYSSSLVFALNSREIMIVGGTEAESEYKVNETYIVKLSEADKNNSFVHIRKGPNLPVKEGFWTPEVEYFDGRFYMLQNISHQKDKKSVLLDQRRLLEYDPREEAWSSVEVL